MSTTEQTQHELVQAVTDLYRELGRIPTRVEFVARVRGGDYKLAKLGGFTVLLQQAGLETYDDRRSGKKGRITNAVFNRDIQSHLEKYEPKAVQPIGDYPTFAIISDIHWPFESKRVIDKFYKYVEENQPEWVIINGDAWDMYCHSKYPRSHNVFTPREEQRLARERNEAFWREIQRISPNSKCVQLMGNHDVRPLRRILEVYPEGEDWIQEKLTELFTFENVHTVMDARQEFYLREDIAVFHGYLTRLGAHRDFTLINCLNGHTHKGGVVFRTVSDGRQIYEGNSGLAGDPFATGLTYTPQKLHNMTPGFLGGDKWGPRFIPA